MEALETRPRNTNVTYARVVREFKKFSDDSTNPVEGRYLVIPSKLAAFVRHLRNRERRGRRGGRLRYVTIKTYMAAMIDFWKFQLLTEVEFAFSCHVLVEPRNGIEGESVRPLEFADMWSIHLTNEGRSPCHALLTNFRKTSVDITKI